MSTAQYHREWHQKNKDKRKIARKLRQREIRLFIIKYKSDRCCIRCSYDKHPAALEFHHRNPEEKSACLAEAGSKGWSNSRIMQEIDKCDLICANCHAIEHAGIV